MKAAPVLLLLACALAPLRAGPLDDAARLCAEKKYPEAEAALRPLAAAQPPDARACYTLGLALMRQGGPKLDEAATWLQKATELAPNEPSYAGDYGGACLTLAQRRTSFSLATRGRDAMQRAIALDPGYLKARDGLMMFYAQAPWPLGSSAKAFDQATEIARRDKAHGLKAYLGLGRTYEKRNSAANARQAYQAALQLDPASADATAGLARLDQKPSQH